MTERILGPEGSKRRKRFWLAPLLVAVLATAFFVAGAAATTHGVLRARGEHPRQSPAGPNLDDWQNLYNGGGVPLPHGAVCTAVILTNCFDTFALTADKIGKEGDVSYFTGGGSKDRETSLRWSWGANDQSPDKNDITERVRGGVSRRQLPGPRLRGGPARGERRRADGLLVQPGADVPLRPRRHLSRDDAEPGEHLLGSSSIPRRVRSRFDTIGDISGHRELRQRRQHRHGQRVPLERHRPAQVLTTTGQDCKNTAYPSNCCTTSNTGSLSGEPPWPYNAKGGAADDDYEASAFIEGFIDLGSITGAGTCFPSFLAETRSSSGPGTDFVLEQLQGLALKSFHGPATRASVRRRRTARERHPAGGASITAAGTDLRQGRGAIVVTGHHDVERTLKFWLCGPRSRRASATTRRGPRYGAHRRVTVSQATVQPVLSPAAMITSAGRYCWRGSSTPHDRWCRTTRTPSRGRVLRRQSRHTEITTPSR